MHPFLHCDYDYCRRHGKSVADMDELLKWLQKRRKILLDSKERTPLLHRKIARGIAAATYSKVIHYVTDHRYAEVAKEIVLRVAHTMELEGAHLSKGFIAERIHKKTEELIREKSVIKL